MGHGKKGLVRPLIFDLSPETGRSGGTRRTEAEPKRKGINLLRVGVLWLYAGRFWCLSALGSEIAKIKGKNVRWETVGFVRGCTSTVRYCTATLIKNCLIWL